MLENFEGEGEIPLRSLDGDLPAAKRAHLEWQRTGCRRSGAEGQCLHLRYAFGGERRSRASVGLDLGSVDASKYDHLELWIRGDGPNGEAPDLKVGFRRPKGGDSRLVEDGTQIVRRIEGGWRRVVIPLGKLSGIRDWNGITTFFVSLDSRRATKAPSGGYWIDDVALLATGGRGPTILDEVVAERRRAWEEAAGGRLDAREKSRQRLTGWPTRLVADAATLPRADRAFLERVAADTWRGIESLTDRENALPLDNVLLGEDPNDLENVRIGDYTNITNIGLHLISIVAARELDLVSEKVASARLRRVLDTLGEMETHEGFFFNYYDTITLERTSNFISFVDSSWLTAGLMVVRQAIPELAARCTRLLDREDYGFFYDDVAQQMSHGYYVNVETRSEYHYGTLYTEARLGSLIAIGKEDAPEEHWFTLVRSYPPEADWQSQRPNDWRTQRVRGHEIETGTYEWKGLRYVPSWGGSMFEALMPTLVVDEQRHAKKSLGENGVVHADIQRRYAEEELGYPIWGLSPAANPVGGGYGEYGAKVLGTLGYGGGAVAPYAAALALGTHPREATANLRRMAERYPVYGEYGFYDAVDPASGAVAHAYLALDQSMILISLANHLAGHSIQRYFAADPIAKRVLPMLREEKFFDGKVKMAAKDR